MTNCGERWGEIFRQEADRRDFHKTLAKTCQKTGFVAHASCRMCNDFHLVLEGGGYGYRKTVCDYAHLKPVRVFAAPKQLQEFKRRSRTGTGK